MQKFGARVDVEFHFKENCVGARIEPQHLFRHYSPTIDTQY